MSGGHGIMTVKQTHRGIKSPPGRKGLKNTIRGDPMQFEDDYTRRRAYISRRQKHRKRQRMVRILIFFMILGILAAAGAGIWLFKTKGFPGSGSHPAPDDPSASSPAEPGADPGNGESGETGTSPAETESSGLDELLSRASGLAASYDYDGAIALLKDSAEFSGEQAVLDAIASYEEIKTTLVRADTASITHVFFHSLIMDNKKAFDGDSEIGRAHV